jgi:hypothetical protein
MEHVSETEWNEYLAGNLQADRMVWIDNHVLDCQACRACLGQAVALNEILGQWQVDPSGHDIADKVNQAVQSKPIQFKSKTNDFSHRRLWSNASRVAATVLIGIFIGHLAGRYSAKNLITKQEGTVIEIKPSYLAGMNLQFASGLIWSVLEDDGTDPEGRQ